MCKTRIYPILVLKKFLMQNIVSMSNCRLLRLAISPEDGDEMFRLLAYKQTKERNEDCHFCLAFAMHIQVQWGSSVGFNSV